MSIVLQIAGLIIGFALLIKGADIFVSASVNIAKFLKISNVVIGLTIVAMGTSAPEVVISVSAALSSSSDLAIANSVGSNLFNLLFIVGFCALLYPISIKLKEISRDYWVSVGATLLLLVMVIVWGDTIPRLGGLIFLVSFTIYMFIVVRHALKNKVEDNDMEDNIESKPIIRSIFFTVLGAALIIGGGHLTVTNAVNIALTVGITERVVGLTIVSMGTSLPELVTTLTACRKGEGEFAIGFIIGSSIFNIMFVLGLAGFITPLTVDSGVIFDITVLTIGTLAFFLFAYSSKRVVRLEGFAMVMTYLTYMVFIILQTSYHF